MIKLINSIFFFSFIIEFFLLVFKYNNKAINFIVTVNNMRTNGMGMHKLPFKK